MITIATRGIMAGGKGLSADHLSRRNAKPPRRWRRGRTYRALLQFSDQNGAVPVTPCSTGGPGPSRTVNAVSTWFGPVIQAGGQKWSQTTNLSGPNAQAAIATLRTLAIRITR